MQPHVSTYVSNTINTPDNFVAGKISASFDTWQNITSDPWILNTVRGYEIEFEQQPVQTCIPNQLSVSITEEKQINAEIKNFLAKGIIHKVNSKPGQYFSNIFIRPKKDGSVRLILNLKQFNANVEKIHFKMETLKTVVNAMRKNCFFASVDLKDAYYSVPVAQIHRKYLRFKWFGNMYEFTCLPNGLASAPRVFTKLLKPVFASLRQKGFTNVAYIDDSCLLGESYNQCRQNVKETVCKLVEWA